MVTAAVGCGIPFTATGGTGSSSSGVGGSSSSGGAACNVGDLTSCKTPGQYCADTSPPSCLPCTDVSRFTFGDLTQLDFQLPDMTANPSYPRIGNGGALYFSYLRNTGTPDRDLGHAAVDPMKPLKWMKGEPEKDVVVNTMLIAEAGELSLPNGDAIKDIVGMADIMLPILLFHRVDTSVSPPIEKIYDTDGTVTEELILPELVLPQVTRNLNVAVAYKASPPRLFYVSNINFSTDELVTYLPGNSMASSILVTLDNGCPASFPWNPWVDPTGSFLFISSPYMQLDTTQMPPACKSVAGAPSHLFYIDIRTVVDITKLQAKPIFPMDKAASRSTPSMSEDLCVLYYTEDNGMNTNVFSAIRR